MIKRYASASPYEAEIGFCRALLVGTRILVAGTAPMDARGASVGVGDAGAQAERCLEIIREAIEALGGEIGDVVRTRIYLTRREDWDAVARVHGQVFGAVRPVATCVVVAGLLRPEWLVEIEAETG